MSLAHDALAFNCPNMSGSSTHRHLNVHTQKDLACHPFTYPASFQVCWKVCPWSILQSDHTAPRLERAWAGIGHPAKGAVPYCGAEGQRAVLVPVLILVEVTNGSSLLHTVLSLAHLFMYLFSINILVHLAWSIVQGFLLDMLMCVQLCVYIHMCTCMYTQYKCVCTHVHP